ncbi:MAG: hypothetical protein QXU98_10895, partial [Candidatus Parvarchaeota archaeon]
MPKIKVALVIFTGIQEGAGTEQVALNIIRYCPKDSFEVYLIENDYVGITRISNEQLSKYISDIKIRHLQFKYQSKLFSLTEKMPHAYLIRNFIMKLILSLFYRKEFKHILYELKPDIIYLFNNPASFYIPNNYKGKVIGSEHIWLPNSKTISDKIFIKLIKNNLFWRRIDGFTCFRENMFIKR